ncbi:hypothetical protein [Myxococcus xanthus]|uniref:Uncharacterized protein n=1 Tax=Myxococcus xanthus TaxID=34 RepID=A0A7Y4IIA0_MYXXA|nr:hypothetical protein [Myxococcus xanthus]NOJ79802.1 hypothetical protein [Myxococcus xanthus]NOJ86807.1 hypothetical protein [Myxococcus xanthus]
MLSFQFLPPRTSRCDCCGGTATRLQGYVYRDGVNHAVYFAQYTDIHPERIVSFVVSLGEWGKGGPEGKRVAFVLALRKGEDNLEMTVTDSVDSPWKRIRLLGQMLDREEALAHPWLKEVFLITEQVFQQDAEVLRYFNPTAAS